MSISEKLEQLKQNVTNEYETFKSNMLQEDPETIYNSFDEIYYYDSMYTYFTNCDYIDEKFIDKAYEKPNIIELTKSIYYETDITVHTWDSIAELLEIYLNDMN